MCSIFSICFVSDQLRTIFAVHVNSVGFWFSLAHTPPLCLFMWFLNQTLNWCTITGSIICSSIQFFFHLRFLSFYYALSLSGFLSLSLALPLSHLFYVAKEQTFHFLLLICLAHSKGKYNVAHSSQICTYFIHNNENWIFYDNEKKSSTEIQYILSQSTFIEFLIIPDID